MRKTVDRKAPIVAIEQFQMSEYPLRGASRELHMASTNDHGLERVTRLDDKTLTALALFDTRHLVWISVILVILTNLIGLLNAVGSIIRES